ncbi:hypothetical protein XU18_4524 [Perkinsela sp. CCAP 1560/4]|nr:hypothetical protein XU18_5018 [Perkinsela sp. CCAP 1560/4]KNH04170.1 hypothetical protein XU18_4524 [Perkinsela sp. CCAP 1560/4]|eukprot:KNH03614.1 hypothetical protein XU18_5018 [Perkinsela sp. CCAP 1560/4]
MRLSANACKVWRSRRFTRFLNSTARGAIDVKLRRCHEPISPGTYVLPHVVLPFTEVGFVDGQAGELDVTSGAVPVACDASCPHEKCHSVFVDIKTLYDLCGAADLWCPASFAQNIKTYPNVTREVTPLILRHPFSAVLASLKSHSYFPLPLFRTCILCVP